MLISRDLIVLVIMLDTLRLEEKEKNKQTVNELCK